MPEKKYLIEIPGKEGVSRFNEKDWTANKDSILAKYPNANITSIDMYDANDIQDNDAYLVSIKGKDGVSQFTGAEWKKHKDAILNKYPDAAVSRARGVDYFYDQANEIKSNMDAQDTKVADWEQRRKDFLANLSHEDSAKIDQLDIQKQSGLQGMAFNDNDPIVAQYNALMAEGDELKAEQDRLRGEYEANPRVKTAMEEWAKEYAQYKAESIDRTRNEIAKAKETDVDLKSAAQAKIAKAQSMSMTGAMSAHTDLKGLAELQKLERLESANYFLDMAQDAKDGKMNGFWKGMKDVGSAFVETIKNRGDIANYVDIFNIMKKLEEKVGNLKNITDEEIDNNLTESERLLLKSYFEYADAVANADADWKYKAGQIGGEGIKFAIEFALTAGASGAVSSAVTKGLTDGIERWAMKAIGNGAKKWLVKTAEKAAIGATRGALNVALQTALRPSTYAQMAQKAIEIDEYGHLNGAKNAAISFVDSTIETISEMSGDAIGKLLGFIPMKGIKGFAGKAFNATLGKTKFGQYGKALLKGAFGDYLKAAGFHGAPLEMLEEVVGSALREMTIDDKAFEESFGGDNKYAMALGFLPMTFMGGAFSMAGLGASQIAAKNASSALATTLTNYKFADGRIKALTDYQSEMSPLEMQLEAKEIIAELKKNGASEADIETVNNYMASKAGYLAMRGAKNEQDAEARASVIAELDSQYGEFYRNSENGKQVTIASLNDGRQVFVTSEKNENGEYSAIDQTTGRGIIINESDIKSIATPNGQSQQMMATTSLDEYASDVINTRMQLAEAERMANERNAQIAELSRLLPKAINLGTTGEPNMAAVKSQDQKGVTVVDAEGDEAVLSWDEVGMKMGAPIKVLTDAQIAEAEAAELGLSRAERRAKRAKTAEQANAVDSEVNAINQEVKDMTPAPEAAYTNPENGLVDEDAFWEGDPEGFCDWNDRLNNDGGQDSMEQIESSLVKLQAKMQETAKMAVDEPKARRAVKAEMQKLQERIDRLTALQQKYAEMSMTEEQKAQERAELVLLMRERVNQWRELLGLTEADLIVYESLEEVEDQGARNQIARAKTEGWYSGASKRAFLFLPDITSLDELDAKVMHEVVTHYGLDKVMTPKAKNQLLDTVWSMMSDAARRAYLTYPGVSNLDGIERQRAAANEFMAKVAESVKVGNASAENKSVWQRIVDFFNNLFKKVNAFFNGADVADFVLENYRLLTNNIKPSMPTAVAEEVAVQPEVSQAEVDTQVEAILNDSGLSVMEEAPMESMTNIVDAATQEPAAIDFAPEADDFLYSTKTENYLAERIRGYAKTKEGKKAGWAPQMVEDIIAETQALITAIHNASTGNEFYDEFAAKDPTIKLDWRDGQLKPTVTWTRGNIEYKYDMSADLLCVNNEGLEEVLSSEKMVALMELFNMSKKDEITTKTLDGKEKTKKVEIGFSQDDYLELYNTLKDLGFVVPCKGCFDAAGRFKMLPSVAYKFAAAVNAVIDERNADPEAFDAALKSKVKKNAAQNGLPTSAKTKLDAIRAGVAGDNLTEHVKWTQLMSADGQTKMLSDWGGIFRAWQRTGAGRPKDKLLPEPYYGDIVSSHTTIIGAYGDKTPSFRDIDVNQGTGLRRNSHSEFRPVLAVDEIQFMRDAYIKGLTVFKYMKELDDVRLFGKMGVKFNMSFFPEYVPGTKAAGLDKDGNYIPSEESVGAREFPYTGEDGKVHYDGMKGWKEAQKYTNKDVSLSSVILSIPHLIKAMTDVPTTFDKSGIWGSLIPFHSSGATSLALFLQGLGRARANGVGHGFEEAFTRYDEGVTNFEAVQNDRFGKGWIIVEGKEDKVGTAVEEGHKLEFVNGKHYYNSEMGLHLFASMYVFDSELPEGALNEDGTINLPAKELKKIAHKYEIDYNNKVREIGTPTAYAEAADYYLDLLPKLGLKPRFDFDVPEDVFLQMCEDAKVDPTHPKLGWKGKGHPWNPIHSAAYYSLFCDYGMTDPATGEWAPHNPVGYVNENGEREFRMPENTVEIVKEGLDRYSGIRRSESAKIDEAINEFAKRSVEKGRISKEAVESVLGEGLLFSTTSPKIDGNTNNQAEGNILFSTSDKTLVGLHNITAEKLRKVFKQGGLANPSTAVINIAEYSLEGFGEISLVMPPSLIDAKKGNNVGTYTGDAWTPVYPPIMRQLDEGGWSVIKDRVAQTVGEGNELYSDIVNGMRNFLEYNTYSRMERVFLKEKGIEIPMQYKSAEGYVGKRMLEVDLGIKDINEGIEAYEQYKNASPAAKYSFNLWLQAGGKTAERKKLKELIKKEPKMIDLLGLREDVSFAQFDSFAYNIFKKQQEAGRLDSDMTLLTATQYVDKNGLRAEYDQWLETLLDEANAEEVFFAGYNKSGNRVYKKNTLENVSRYMRQQEKVNSYNNGGLSATKSVLLDRMTSLSQIKKNREKLQGEEAYNDEYDALKDRLFNLISDLADMKEISSNRFMNLDYAEKRLQDAITRKDPIAYLNQEYNYSIESDSEFSEELQSFIEDVKNMPAKYFETKFNRPVYVNEFAAAVIPSSTNEDIKKSLSEAGIPIYEYDPSVEGARKATIEETAKKENLMFSTSNRNQAIFVSNAAKAVEGIKMEKATPEQWLKMIEKSGGLKAGEDKWMGLSDWLKASDKKTLTKDEVMQFINDNMIVIEEQHYGELGESNREKAMHDNMIAKYGQDFYNRFVGDAFLFEDAIYGEGWVLSIENEDTAIDLYNEYSGDTITASQYGLDGYEMEKIFAWAERLVKDLEVVDNVKEIDKVRKRHRTDGLSNYHEIALTVPTIEPWEKSKTNTIHFEDAGEGRAVVWTRFGDTTTEDGKKVLVIDEVQSARHEAAREEKDNADGNKEKIGYKDKAKIAEIETQIDALLAEREKIAKDILHKQGYIFHDEEGGKFSEKEEYDALTGRIGSQEQMARQKEIDTELYNLNRSRRKLYNAIPAAPFEKNWQELAMKRMLRYAAENGYDAVAWTKGEQQAERYGIGKVVSSVGYRRTDDGKRVRVNLRGGESLLFDVDVLGKVTEVHRGDMISKGMSLNEIVGADLAKQIDKYEGEVDERGDYNIKSENFRIGGEGMKGFYDKMLPAFMNKYGKKWGIKVEDLNLPHLEDGLTMHSVPVTEEMKQSVMEGQLMFSTSAQSEPASEEYVTLFSTRTKPAPTKTQKVYKLMRLGADGRLYPLYIDSAEGIELKVWYDADSPNIGDIENLEVGYAYKIDENGNVVDKKKYNKTAKGSISALPNKEQVNSATNEKSRWIVVDTYADGSKAFYNVGINGSGTPSLFGMRPGWHAGSLPTMRQIGKGPKKDLRDDSFVWVRGYIPADIDYQAEADANPSKDIQTHIPTDGYYLKATNANKKASQADKMGWYIAGSFYADAIISDAEARRVIDEWNTEHPDARVEYDYPRESGKIYDPARGGLVDSDVLFSTNSTNFESAITPEVRKEMDVISAQAIVNGNYLKAPNGKDTKLTPEQWALVRTKNFINWFGDWINDPENASKVVDENGEPRVVYHGTAGVINKFEDQQRSPGFWFVDREDVANGYAESAVGEFGEEKNVIPVFLNLRNPRIEDAQEGYPAEFALKSYVENDNGVYEVFDTYDEAEAYRQTNVPDGWVGAAEVGDQHDLVERAKELGHDGVIMLNMHDQATYAETRVEGTQTNYVVLDANQIKSATENNGEYSESEDIRFSTDSHGIDEIEETSKRKAMFDNAEVKLQEREQEQRVWKKQIKEIVKSLNLWLTEHDVIDDGSDWYIWLGDNKYRVVVEDDLTFSLRDGQGNIIGEYDLSVFFDEDYYEKSEFKNTLETLMKENFDDSMPNLLDNVREDMEEIKRSAIATGDYLKAPNGRLSNLTPNEWLVVRTKHFKDFFGDWENDPKGSSKVVDENGEPQVVYHGSSAIFNVFETSKVQFGRTFGDGSYFTPNLAEATFYANMKREETGGGYVRKFFVRVANEKEGSIQRGIYDSSNTNKVDVIVVKNPQNIKSATENTGTFSSENEDILFSTRQPYESAKAYVQAETDKFYETYNTTLPAKVVYGNSRKMIAEALGYKVEEMPDAMYKVIREEAKKGYACVAAIDGKPKVILVFPREDVNHTAKMARILFHENTHPMISDKPELLDLGKWLIENPVGIAEGVADMVKNKYEEADWNEEMVCDYIGAMMSLGRSQEALDSVPEEYKPLLNYVYERFGYKPENEDPRRRSERLADARELHMRNSENKESNEGNSGLLFSTGREKSVEEIVEEGKQKVSAEHTQTVDAFMDRIRNINGNLQKLRMAAAAQREYDQKTVKTITDIANDLLEGGALNDLTRGEIKRLLSIINGGVGKSDLTKSVDRLMDLMVANQLRFGKNLIEKFLKIRGSKVDQRGVEVRGTLDIPGQQMLNAFKEGIGLSKEKLADRIADAEDALASDSETKKRNAENELVGLYLAKQYHEDINDSIEEEKDLRNEIKVANEDYKAGRITKEMHKQLLDTIYEAILENRIQRVNAYEKLASDLGAKMVSSIKNAGLLRDAEKERVQKIQHFANSDMQGMPASTHEVKQSWFWNNALMQLITSPLVTFEQWLRVFGEKSAEGKGYLWNHFMTKWNEANNNEFKGMQEAHRELDFMVRSIFGGKYTKWSDLFSIEKEMPTLKVSIWDDGEMKDYELSQGNLLYIYMVNKMTDGKMKLRKMGITQDVVDAIVLQMDPRFIQLADWMQERFLPSLRDKYNAVHERLFGAPMASIDNYFPIKVNQNARVREVDVEAGEGAAKPATITGSIIKRTKNSLALDVLNADAFDVMLEHIQQMEHWAAFAEFNKDLNTLLSYKKFRNRVQNMSGVMGAGVDAWKNFKESAEIAAGVYKPKTGKADKAITNIVKGLTAGKISFRLWTAMKQILSMPAFAPYTNLATFGKNLATPMSAFDWAMENLPAFEKRWKSREAGNVRLKKTEADIKLADWMETATRLGMTPNAFVDAITCAIGAKSVYETKYNQYVKDGYTAEQADERAKLDATVAFNATQQSSEAAFLSAIQIDRTFVSHALTVFRNNSFGMQRELADAVRNMRHRMSADYKDKSIEFMKKQMVRDGLTEDKAERAAQRIYRNSVFKDAARIATFGFMMQFLWALGNSAVYLLFGDDDDEKKEMLKDAAIRGAFGSVEGLGGGNFVADAMSALATGEFDKYKASFAPAISDIESLMDEMKRNMVAGASELVNILSQTFIGVNPQIIADTALAIYDACDGDLETSKEVGILILRMLQAPQSNIDKLFVDEIDFAKDKGLDLTIEEFAQRYADYKAHRNAPYTYWMYDDEGEKKQEQKYIKRFLKDAEELKRSRGNEEAKKYYEYLDTDYKETTETINELRRKAKESAMKGNQMESLEYAKMLDDFMKTDLFKDYVKFGGKAKAIETIRDKMKKVDMQTRESLEDMMLELRREMVQEMEEANR